MDKTSSLYVKKRPAFRFGSIIKLIMMASIVGSAVCLYEGMGISIEQRMASMMADIQKHAKEDSNTIWLERITAHTLTPERIDTIHVSPDCRRLLAMPYNPQYPIPEVVPGNTNNPYTYLRIYGRLDHSQYTGFYYVLPPHPPSPDEQLPNAKGKGFDPEHHDAMIGLAKLYNHPIDGPITINTPIHIVNYSTTLNKKNRIMDEDPICSSIIP